MLNNNLVSPSGTPVGIRTSGLLLVIVGNRQTTPRKKCMMCLQLFGIGATTVVV